MAQSVSPSPARDVIDAATLVHVPGARDHAEAVLIEGGSVNATYRVETPAGTFVVRTYGDMSGALLADHDREAVLHQAAANAGLAPRLIHFDPLHRFLITEHITGRTWSAEDFAQESQLRRLGALLRRLHSIAAPKVSPFDLNAILTLYVDEIARAAPAERPQLDAFLSRVPAALSACGSERRRPTIMHSDLHHSNLIDADRLILIDWEYAAVTDPIFDLASILAYYPQAAPHAPLLLDSSGLAAQGATEMLRHASWLYLLLAYLWHRYLRAASPELSDATEKELLTRLLGGG